MQKPSIPRLLELQSLLQQFSHVERVTHRQHHGRFVPENDTEHSYNLALTAWFLVQHFPKLNRDMVIRLALVHDLVEVHAGDTNVYAAPEILATKHAREAAALQKLRLEWKDFPELLADITAYEARESEEAKFVYALDKLMPIMLIFINKGHTWHQEGTSLEMLDAVKRSKVALSPEIKPYYDELYAVLLEHRHYFSS